MADSGARAPLVAMALVFGAALAAYVWQQRHAGAPDVANGMPVPLASPPGPPLVAPSGPSNPPEVPKPPAPAAAAGEEPPHFDVVRVEPGGAAVIAGKGAPGARIELLASGKVVAEAKADPGGNFVILPSNLTPGGYDLTLRQMREGKPAVASTQGVAVAIPAKGGEVVVALSEPGKPTKLLATKTPPEKTLPEKTLPARPVVPRTPMVLPAPAQPVPPPPAPEVVPPVPTPPAATIRAPEIAAIRPAIPAPPPGVAIRSVELENGDGFFASGTAAAGAKVRIYLNDTPLTEVAAGANGQWTVTIRKGLAGGHYTVRADAGSGTAVTARAEVPFDVPVAMAETAPVPVTKAAPARPAAAPTKRADAAPSVPPVPDANAVIDQVETAVVVPGDNLWNISRARLGHGKRFTQIYAANTSQIRNPRLIYPGQVLVVPPR